MDGHDQARRALLLAAAGLGAGGLSACASSGATPAAVNASLQAEEARLTDEFTRVYAGRDAAATLAMLADDIYFEDITSHFVARNREEMRQFIEPVPQLYAELRVAPINRIQASPWVLSQQRVQGVMNKPDGTTRPIDVQGLSMLMWRDGKIVKWYDYYDVLSFRQQAR